MRNDMLPETVPHAAIATAVASDRGRARRWVYRARPAAAALATAALVSLLSPTRPARADDAAIAAALQTLEAGHAVTRSVSLRDLGFNAR